MEGIPRMPMLAVEMKSATSQFDEEFVLQVKEYILMHFQDDPSNHDAAIREIMQLKQQISKTYVDVEMTCVMKRYLGQMMMMKNRFPMEEGDPIRCAFSWLDCAADVPHASTYADIGYELCSVMYNIGAAHSYIGAKENRESEDSIKNAFMHFQQAAWPLQNLRDNMGSSRFAVVDFEPDLLTFYINILLAQAQECLVEKSLIDHRNHMVVAKLAAYTGDLHQKCGIHLDDTQMAGIIPSSKFKVWRRMCNIKSEMYRAIGMICLGMDGEEKQKMGLRYGAYQVAMEHMKNAGGVFKKDDSEGLKASYAFLLDVVQAKLENAKKENDFIYHEKVPDAQQCFDMIEPLCKVKPLNFNALDPSICGDDIFGSLLPADVLKASSEYEEEKASLKREILAKVAVKDEELNTYLDSLRIDEINFGYGGGSESGPLPEMLQERNAALVAQPDAVPQLLDKLKEVDDLACQAEQLIGSGLSRMNAIDLPDLITDRGYTAIKEEITRLEENHRKAKANNAELRNALIAHSRNLHVLGLPNRELSAQLSTNAQKPESTVEGAKLRQVLDKANEMQAQRAMLVSKLAEELNRDNINKMLLADRNKDHKATFTNELKKHGETIKYIEANLTAQANILNHLTEANADFSEQRKLLREVNSSRNDEVMTLVTAYDIFLDVKAKADDGKRFYEKLLDRMRKMNVGVDGIETAFLAEKSKHEEERRRLEQRMAALRLASETKEAMAEFGGIGVGPGGGGMPGGGAPYASQAGSRMPYNSMPSAAPGGRPRLGDIMRERALRGKMQQQPGGGAGQMPSQPNAMSYGGGPTGAAVPYAPGQIPGGAQSLPGPMPSQLPYATQGYPPAGHHPGMAPPSLPAPVNVATSMAYASPGGFVLPPDQLSQHGIASYHHHHPEGGVSPVPSVLSAPSPSPSTPQPSSLEYYASPSQPPTMPHMPSAYAPSTPTSASAYPPPPQQQHQQQFVTPPQQPAAGYHPQQPTLPTQSLTQTPTMSSHLQNPMMHPYAHPSAHMTSPPPGLQPRVHVPLTAPSQPPVPNPPLQQTSTAAAPPFPTSQIYQPQLPPNPPQPQYVLPPTSNAYMGGYGQSATAAPTTSLSSNVSPFPPPQQHSTPTAGMYGAASQPTSGASISPSSSSYSGFVMATSQAPTAVSAPSQTFFPMTQQPLAQRQPQQFTTAATPQVANQQQFGMPPTSAAAADPTPFTPPTHPIVAPVPIKPIPYGGSAGMPFTGSAGLKTQQQPTLSQGWSGGQPSVPPQPSQQNVPSFSSAAQAPISTSIGSVTTPAAPTTMTGATGLQQPTYQSGTVPNGFTTQNGVGGMPTLVAPTSTANAFGGGFGGALANSGFQQFAGQPNKSASPWHQGTAAANASSPWHSGLNTPPVGAAPQQPQQAPQMMQGFVAPPQHQQFGNPPTVLATNAFDDLMSSSLAGLTLPPAMQPMSGNRQA